jgi:ribosomal protein S27AE
MNQPVTMESQGQRDVKGWAYCPICTHVVETPVKVTGRKIVVKPGQKCPRCGSALEAASIVRYEVAA